MAIKKDGVGNDRLTFCAQAFQAGGCDCDTPGYEDEVGNDNVVDLSCTDSVKVLRTLPMELTDEERDMVKGYLKISDITRAYVAANGHLFIVMNDGTERDVGDTRGIPGDTPEFGDNGNWFIGGKDTGVPATGPKGDAPYIGENGNWWVSGTDTGVSAGIYAVGDVVETFRTDLGENWVLCNGDTVPEGAYPDLREVLPYNTEWRKVPVNGIHIRPLPKDGEWEIVLSEYSPHNQFSTGQKIGLYNSNTETYIEIAKPVLDTTIGYGIFGITHDGDRYILGVVEDVNDTVVGVIHLFASTDLETWSECYSFACASAGYVPYQLTFDGLNIVCIEKYYSTSYAHRIVAIDKAMTKTTVLLSSGSKEDPYYLRQLPSGYWSYGTEDANAISVYPAGERQGALFTLDRYLTSDAYVASAAFFNEKYWITLPKPSGSTTYILVTNLETNEEIRINISDIVDTGEDEIYNTAFYGAVYDRNTDGWLLYVKFQLINSSNALKSYVVYVPQNFDWIAPTKCRYEEIASIPQDLTNEQMALDKSRIRTVSTSEVYICNPNIKFLPTHDGDTYKYIYAGDELRAKNMELEYIESTGTQYIDTGFKPNQNTRIVLDFENTGDYSAESAGASPLFGARNATTSAAFGMWIGAVSYPHYGNAAYNANGSFSTNINARLIYEMNGNVASIGNETITCGGATFTTTCNLLVLAFNTNGTHDKRHPSGRFYSCKIYDNDTLVRDYVPCRLATGTVCMYDRVSGEYAMNKGSGKFIAGAEIGVLEEETT